MVSCAAAKAWQPSDCGKKQANVKCVQHVPAVHNRHIRYYEKLYMQFPDPAAQQRLATVRQAQVLVSELSKELYILIGI